MSMKWSKQNRGNVDKPKQRRVKLDENGQPVRLSYQKKSSNVEDEAEMTRCFPELRV
jgi:hypothetical protein